LAVKYVDSIAGDCYIYWVAEFDLKTLCDDTGVSPRTVYFYVQQGLLPPADGAGRGARYSQVHRDRLRLIRQLQDQHLPLAEIRKQIEGLSQNELSRLAERAEDRAEAPPQQQSAADYIRSVLSGQELPLVESVARHSLSARTLPPTTPAAGHVSTGERSQWERIALAPEIELHVRRPLSRVMNRKLERLLELARALMKEHS
jgi:DNA-binding transcriptional MerR regulator